MTTTRSDAQDPRPRLRPRRPVRVVTEQTSVAEALRIMRVDGVRHLPVIAGDRCTGLLVDRDLIAAAVDGVTLPVGRLARGHVPTVEAGATPSRVARAVLAGGLDAAVVVEEGAVVGIVTTTDALVALAHLDED
ncbi:CBS domain-containing protein [Actinomycetospora straminea]|nr:CBS domain-containing protein [Actinomycetospora straminea]MDD7933239.1 CBS domain-containing protein [Actinomycetospora straminea]